jgi:hypothetical protein
MLLGSRQNYYYDCVGDSWTNYTGLVVDKYLQGSKVQSEEGKPRGPAATTDRDTKYVYTCIKSTTV